MQTKTLSDIKTDKSIYVSSENHCMDYKNKLLQKSP